MPTKPAGRCSRTSGDKDGHRWWLWVFVTGATTVFVMDTSRSAGVAAGQLGIDREQTALEAGRRLVISSDFHKAYQSLACIDGVDPLWCWAHIRRYFLRAGAAQPEALGDWCDAWTERGSSLSNFLCKPGQSLSFCYITVDSFRCPGQTGTRLGNVTANAFMAAFQPRVPVPRCPLSRTSPSPSMWRPVTFLIPR